MRKRAFTLIELLVAVVVTGILGTLAIGSYRQYLDRANMLVDETNQKILQLAVQLYATDNDALPANLSRLRPRDLERAYAMWRVAQPEVPRLWARIRGWGGVAIAEATAGVLYPSTYVSDIQILTCRSDRTPPPSDVSYTLNPVFAGAPRSVLSDPDNAGQELIYEADRSGAAEVFRHGATLLAPAETSIATTVIGKVKRNRRVRQEYERRGDRERGRQTR